MRDTEELIEKRTSLYDPSYSVDDIDCFQDTDDLQTTFITEDEADNLFGLGNQKKRAERKIRKGEKQIAKGHIKKGERKLGKGQAILSKIQQGQAQTQQALGQLQDVNATQAVINATNPNQTESMNTAAGQIGSVANPMVTPEAQSGGGGGGDVVDSSGGDMTGMDASTQDTANTSEPPYSGSTSDSPDTKTLDNVTVKSTTGNKNLKYLLIGIAVIVVLYFGYKYFIKKK